MILALTPNPALDKTAVVPGFTLGRIFRVSEPRCQAGGKGFNVARALRILGAEPLVIGPLAGHTGALVRDLAEAEGLACDFTWIGGETRTCQTVVDPETGCVTELYESGPAIGRADWEQIVDVVRRHLPTARWLAVSGGFPRGTPEEGLRVLIEHAHAAHVSVGLDTYGAHLALALASRPALVKINQHEAEDLLDRSLDTPTDLLAGAVEIQRRGAQAVVLTLGAAGTVGVDATGRSFAWLAPTVASVSAVGSGDSFFAGVIAGLARGETLQTATRLGVAAGAANTLHIGAAVFEREEADALLGRVEEQVPPLAGGN